MSRLEDEYRWYLIEQNLGSLKTAALRYEGLDRIVIKHAEAAYGVELNGFMDIPDAVATLSKRAYLDRAEFADVEDGLRTLQQLSPQEKTASAKVEMPWDSMSMLEKIAHSKQLVEFRNVAAQNERAKYASIADDMLEVLHADIYDGIRKNAGALGTLLGAAGTGNTMASKGLGGLAQGAGLAAGASVPLYMLGQAYNEDARDKALQVAGGTAALGTAVLGANKLMDHMGTKSAALGRTTNAYEEFLATLYLDEKLRAAPYTEKIAELSATNQAYGVSLLYRIIE